MAETEKERVDRELIELLNELRVALPGVQVLFAFLLILPFQQGFASATDLERGVYFAAFLFATVSSVLFIAPSSFHRLRFRDGDKAYLLGIGNRLLIGGMASLGVAISAVAFLIAEVLYGAAAGALVAALVAVFLGWFWFGLAISRKARGLASGPHEED